MMKKPALTIAGFDPCGGAGILADVKTFHAHGVRGLAVITALTVQDSARVFRAEAVDIGMLRDQLFQIFEFFPIDCVKIGMLHNEKIVETVARVLEKTKPPRIALDPVVKSGGGYPLLSPKGLAAMIERLFPLATLITPNAPEALTLLAKIAPDAEATKLSKKIRLDPPESKIAVRKEEIERIAKILLKTGTKNVVIKGGHLTGDADDFLCGEMEGGFQSGKAKDFYLGKSGGVWFKGERIGNKNVHGTGCVFSSSIAANLALGENVATSVRKAKEFTARMIAETNRLSRRHPLRV